MILFTTGTINQPDAGSVGLAMIEQIRDDVAAHDAWEFVEEFTSGTLRWYIFKCLASESGLEADFYVIINRTLATGRLMAWVAEGYNTGTKAISGFPCSVTSSNIVYDSEGRNPATFTLAGSTPSGAGDQPTTIQWTPGGVSSKYWITVDDDGFSVAFNGAANGFFHFGAFVPLSDVVNDMPIAHYGNSGGGGVTRNPALAGVTTQGYGSYIQDAVRLGFTGRMDVNDALQGGQRAVAEVGMGMGRYSTATIAITGYAMGKYKRIRMGESGTAPAGITFGDAYVLDGTLWVPYAPDDYRIWDTGVAA